MHAIGYIVKHLYHVKNMELSCHGSLRAYVLLNEFQEAN